MMFSLFGIKYLIYITNAYLKSQTNELNIGLSQRLRWFPIIFLTYKVLPVSMSHDEISGKYAN